MTTLIGKPPSGNLPWHAATPAPKTVVASLPRQELLKWFRGGKQAGKGFLLVGLRRADFEIHIYP